MTIVYDVTEVSFACKYMISYTDFHILSITLYTEFIPVINNVKFVLLYTCYYLMKMYIILKHAIYLQNTRNI